MVRRNVPLVDQVILEIMAQVESGAITRPNGLLPSEVDLAQQFGVSRATIREALGRLELAGVIVRRHGVGTFVNVFLSKDPVWLQDWLEEARGFTDAIRDSGRAANCRMLTVEVRAAGEWAEWLQMDAQEPVLLVEKVISTDGVPIINSSNVVPLQLLLPEYRPQACQLASQADSTYSFLDLYCHVAVQHQQSEVRAVTASPELAAHLEMEPGAPLLRVEEVAYGQELTPVFYGMNYYRGDSVSFRQVRRPIMAIAHAPAPVGGGTSSEHHDTDQAKEMIG